MYSSEKNQDVDIGVVTDCVRLNIRKEPKVGSQIIGKIDRQTELMIEGKASTDDFYKVCTAAGIEGFCMKKFIAIRQ
jgi:uncharacterized protein YgiM (DUF1202 family)